MEDGAVVVESGEVKSCQFIPDGGVPGGVGPFQEVFLQVGHVLLDHRLRGLGSRAGAGPKTTAELFQTQCGKQGRRIRPDRTEEESGDGRLDLSGRRLGLGPRMQDQQQGQKPYCPVKEAGGRS